MPFQLDSRSNNQGNTLARELPIGIFIGAILALSQVHYLWFHTAVEFTSATIGITLYIIASSSYHLHRNDFLLFIAEAFFWSACLDVIHAMVYPGMGLAGNDFNPPPQLWIGARSLEAIVLLLAPLLLKPHRKPRGSFWLMGIAAFGWGAAVFKGWLPPFFVAGSGLTQIKVAWEYAIVATLLLAGYALYRRRSQLPEDIGSMIFGMLGLTIATELCFTLYHSMYDVLNLLGHVFKVLSYGLMLRIVLTTMIDQPFRVMSRNAYSFDAIPLPVLVLDPQGVVRACNAKARAIRPAGGIGQTLPVAWQVQGSDGDYPVSAAIAAGRAFAGDINADGRWINVVLQPVSGGGDSPTQGFVCVLSDITDRHEGERALTAAKERAEDFARELARKNKDLERFTLILSHHLQEPVRLQHIYAQLLLRRLPQPLANETREAADAVLQGALRLQRLLLDVQRYLSAGQEDTGSCAVGFALARGCRGGERDRLAASGELEVALAEGLPPVAMAADHLAEVFAILLDNALAYRSLDRRLRVRVSADRRGDVILLTVADNGIGIAPEYRDRVFQLFERLSPDLDSGTGTGIGLALAKKLVESAGGRIWADNPEGPEGVGTRICIELPSDKVNAESDTAAVV
jgi:signal transduction histidine kinase